jgi:hypothetical protein
MAHPTSLLMRRPDTTRRRNDRVSQHAHVAFEEGDLSLEETPALIPAPCLTIAVKETSRALYEALRANSWGSYTQTSLQSVFGS